MMHMLVLIKKIFVLLIILVGLVIIFTQLLDILKQQIKDTNVQSVISADNAKYPIHLNNGTAATTNTALIDTSIYANPSTNTIGADIVSVASKVNVAYNTNTSSLDFNWV